MSLTQTACKSVVDVVFRSWLPNRVSQLVHALSCSLFQRLGGAQFHDPRPQRQHLRGRAPPHLSFQGLRLFAMHDEQVQASNSPYPDTIAAG